MGTFNQFFLICGLAILSVSRVGAADATLTNARKLEKSGDFKKATELLAEASKKHGLSAELNREYQWETELMERIRQDYGLSEERLFQKLSAAVKGLTKDEFNAWMKEHRFDGRKIDGEMRYVVTSINNLFWRHPDLNSRRQPPKELAAYHRSLFDTAHRVKTAALEEKKALVLPTHFKCTMTVTAEKNSAKNGKMIRAWLPVPRAYPFQKDFVLLDSSSPVKYLSHEDSPIRSVYLEQNAIENQPTKFSASYEYVRNGIYFDLKANEVSSGTVDPSVRQFTEQAPHVVFTPQLKALAKDIIVSEKNPLLQARAFYNWISENIKYSFAREYSTLTNISDYCLSNGYGDCGQEALLFITLCRSQGIPARWQSGWNLFPSHVGIHDWTEIYLEPYGWVPVDPWAGIYVMHYCTDLSNDEKRELRDFYFGGLDQYRMSANADHSQQLQPPKKGFRSDDVDFQRGELESGKNIYFDKYNYDLQVEETSSAK
ncbi:MAG: Transglutaminase domain protein [Verrucomicrobiales bacterium]|nr:Transglutaminase domain protein [Verrucomicrobiales bacterium]